MKQHCTQQQYFRLAELGVKDIGIFNLYELLRMAPEGFEVCKMSNTEYEGCFNTENAMEVSERFNNPSEAAAQLLIELIEKKIIGVEGINERLKN